MSRQQKRAGKRAEDKAAAQASASGSPGVTSIILDPAKRLKAKDLSDLQVRGAALARAILAGDGRDERRVIDDEKTMYVRAPRGKEAGRRVHDVTRRQDNQRGTLRWAYTCDCEDYAKNGFKGCLHTLAEQIIRAEVVIDGEISEARVKAASARRRAPRKRVAADGRSVRTTQESARNKMIPEVTRLVGSLHKAYVRELRQNASQVRDGNVIILANRPPTNDATRAMCLLTKVARRQPGVSMHSVFKALIGDGMLPGLDEPPHANTMTHWTKDPTLTPILRRWLAMTAYAYRLREIGAIIDSSKVSQMRTAHHRGVEYGGDERPGAEWMRCHVLVGVETMVVMAAEFGGNIGLGKTHDSIFMRPLVSEAVKSFNLHYLLADKAYWARKHIEWLWEETSIRAVISAKKNTDRDPQNRRHARDVWDPYFGLVEWQDQRERDFHEVYRLRPKIEGFFSLLKRVAGEQMWSRGRAYKLPDGSLIYDPMKDGPCTAWVNEALCKLIYMNLRTTVTLQEETGVEIDYLAPDRCFPQPTEPLLKRAA